MRPNKTEPAAKSLEYVFPYFYVNGRVRGQSRHRTRVMMKGGRAIPQQFIPKQDRDFRSDIRAEFTKAVAEAYACTTVETPPVCPWQPFNKWVILEVQVFFRVPKAKKKKLMKASAFNRLREFPCTRRPDLDNILKAIGDALNENAWTDDSIIISCEIEKLYDHCEGLGIKIHGAWE